MPVIKPLLDIAAMSAENPDSVDAGITRFFFFDRNETLEKEHVPFTENFDHKYLISIDGTVAAYRLPQLLLGNSLVMKQKSQYYEHYYSLLNKNKPHVLEVANDLSDLERKLDWIRKNQDEAQEMIKNANELVDRVLQPINVYSYWLKVIQVNYDFSLGKSLFSNFRYANRVIGRNKKIHN